MVTGRPLLFACGDVVPDCLVTFTGLTEDDILAQVVGHARADHRILHPPPELADLVRAAIHEPPEPEASRSPAEAGELDDRSLSDERIRSAFDDAPTGLAITSPTGRFLEVNPALCEMLGRSQAELLGLKLDDVVAPGQVRKTRTGRDKMIRGRTRRHHSDVRLVRADGEWLVSLLTCSLVVDGSTAAPLHIIYHFQDITDRVAERDALAHQSLHDPLTGLPNRLLLFDRIEQALRRGLRRSSRVALLFCDLDDFKAVNDAHGHAAGDQVLIEVAARLQASLRPTDTVARLSGDEFVLLCQDEGELDVAAIVTRIQQHLAEPYELIGHHLTLTASIGVAVAYEPATTAAALLQAADQAMYAVKRTRGLPESQVARHAVTVGGTWVGGSGAIPGQPGGQDRP